MNARPRLAVIPTITRHAWVVLLLVGVALALGAWTVARETPVYHAQASLLVVPSARVVGSSSEATVNAIDMLHHSGVLNTVAEMTTSAVVVQRAAGALGYSDADVAALRSRATVLPGTFTVQVAVEGADPARAAGLATGLAQQTGPLVSEVYPALAVQVLEEAAPPATPLRPQPVRDLGLAALSGLLIGLISAFAVGRLSEWAKRSSAPDGFATDGRARRPGPDLEPSRHPRWQEGVDVGS